MAEDTPDLEQFLADRPEYRAPCGTCELPEELRTQMDAVVVAMRSSMTKKPPWTGMSEWLRKQGYKEIGPDRLKRHYDRGHHER